MKRVKFIYNPTSGEAFVADRLDAIVGIYQNKGFSIIPYRLTFEDEDTADIVSDIDHTYHHVLIAGGDGTVNFVVNLLKEHDIDIPIAVLPAGTANDFAHMLGMPSDIIAACRKIVSGEIRNVDLGYVNGNYFVNVFSCGLFTDVSQKTPTLLKNTFGKLAYYIGGLGELPKFRKMTVNIKTDGGDFEGTCLVFFVFNGKTAGRFRIAYKSEIDDGLLDVIVFKGDSPQETIRTAFHFLSVFPRIKEDYPAGVVHIQCSKLTAECAPDEPTDVDGQAGPSFPLEMSCAAGAQRVIFPKAKK